MSISDYQDEDVEKMYHEIKELIRAENGNDYLVVIGDWIAVVAEGKDAQEVEGYIIEKRNERGQTWLKFCRRQHMIVTNTWFKQHKLRRCTWKMPEDRELY